MADDVDVAVICQKVAVVGPKDLELENIGSGSCSVT